MKFLDEPVWRWLIDAAHNYKEGLLTLFVVLFAITLANIFARFLVGRDE